jgi:asparagine synthase (glutamine-hydrolysing)
MCGIVGIASKYPVRDRELLLRMRDTMVHRGPDDQGAEWLLSDTVGLAHRRLSIIDLSPRGHQPMKRGNVHITFNGEIYNYRELKRTLEDEGHKFQSDSDTEVILAAYQEWGQDAVRHLNGMFAFCIVDTVRKQLYLARDRAGEKPLFYYLGNRKLLFASELKALLAHPDVPRKLDPAAFDNYLTYGYVSGDQCMLSGVKKLPPAHAISYDMMSSDLNVWPYWQLPDHADAMGTTIDETSLLDELESLLSDSVRLRLIADVPLGVLLSGGLDSSIVTALAARNSSQPLKTFTVSFPGTGRFDETDYAAQVANHFGTDHAVLEASQQDVDLFPTLARQYDEPIGDPSMVPTFLVSREIRRHATVALGGDGGDELFAGYRHYSWLASQLALRRYLPGAVRTGISKLATSLLPIGFPARNQLIGMSSDVTNCIAHVHVYFDEDSRNALLAQPARSALHGRDSSEKLRRQTLHYLNESALHQATAIDFLAYMPDDVLVKVDRASMLTSLEVRAPLLDHRVIEFAFGRVPDSLKANSSERKIMLKRIARRLLPQSFNVDRKQGFSVPSNWFSQGWGNFIEEILYSAPPTLFDPRFIRDLISGQKKGCRNSERLFALTMFELWRDAYSIKLPE